MMMMLPHDIFKSIISLLMAPYLSTLVDTLSLHDGPYPERACPSLCPWAPSRPLTQWALILLLAYHKTYYDTFHAT